MNVRPNPDMSELPRTTESCTVVCDAKSPVRALPAVQEDEQVPQTTAN
jgi:hypothetical protein